jgi:hypothetical protein
VATWASLPECDEIVVSRASFSSDFSRSVIHDFRLSHALIASAGATIATIDFTDVPRFRPEWCHDPALEQSFSLVALRGTLPDDHTSSEVLEEAPAPTAADTAPRCIDPQRAMAQVNAHRNQLQRLHRATRPGAR